MATSGPATRRVLIVGGGVAALEAALALRELAEERVETELVAPQRTFPYRPLAVAEPFGAGPAVEIDAGEIADRAGAALREDTASSVDAKTGEVACESGERLAYDELIVACGARQTRWLEGATTFWGRSDEAFASLVDELDAGSIASVAFVVPPGSGWPLPLYELALLSRKRAATRRRGGLSLEIVSPEPSPLAAFGRQASEDVARLLEAQGIGFRGDSYVSGLDDGRLALVPGDGLAAERVVTLPRLEGSRLPGLPHDAGGFIPVDEHARVLDTERVYAAGDATSVPLKQGGIAAQQADAAAETIAADAGAPITAAPFTPVLRGLLLTGERPEYLRAEVSGGHGEASEASHEALWWPPGKIVGRYLSPCLAEIVGTEMQPPRPGGVEELEVTIDSPPVPDRDG